MTNMAKTYFVTSELATPYREDGTRVYLYSGTEWPHGLREGETERFLDLGFIEEGNKPSEDADAKPAKSATKADWEAYARTQGASDEDIDGKTKDELVAAYGG